MAVQWDSTAFSVVAIDGTIPGVGIDENGIHTYTAEIMLASAANMRTLREDVSTVTVVPAMGARNAGTVVIEAGTGGRSLTLPLPDGAEETWTAVLVSFEPMGNLLHDDAWTAEASWILIEEV
jgi:hypothetical protein